MGCFKRSKRRYLQLFRQQRNVEFVFELQRHAQRHSAAASANGSENSSAKSSEKLMAAPMEASDSGRGCEIEEIHEGQGKNGLFSGASNENVVKLAEASVDRADENIGLGPLGGYDERVRNLEEILKLIATGNLVVNELYHL